MRRLTALALLLLMAAVPAARAHGDVGVLELTLAEAGGGQTVRYEVLLTYANDGDPASGAEVVARVDGGESVTMDDGGGGRYAATVTFPAPGEHTVTFTSTEPAATLEHREVVAAPTTTTEAPATGGTFDDQLLPELEEEEPGPWWLLVVMGAFAAAMIVVAVAYFRGRKPPAR
ncbi:MAG TPA: hypothetical protein VM262_04585 [Acidimicrobiales bacterium]|nr:hypothetical protein [Acidimicrobiales bacterium]